MDRIATRSRMRDETCSGFMNPQAWKGLMISL